jgi:hypothetical protein
LGNHVQTSDNDGTSQRDEGSQSFEGLSDLSCKFSRRRKDEAKEGLGLLEQRL